jgi:hypothetical protein
MSFVHIEIEYVKEDVVRKYIDYRTAAYAVSVSG